MAVSALFKAFPCTGRPTAPVIEFLPDTVFFTLSTSEPPPRDGVVFFCIDDKLTYNNFYLDFGPHNLGCTFQFCVVMNKILAKTTKQIYFYSSTDPQLRANAVCLLACWGVLFHGMTPHEAFAPFTFMSFPPFHDASPLVHMGDFKLTIRDCLHGLARAMRSQYLDPHAFDLTAYHHFEQVENGDLTWVSPKFIAFAGPQSEYALTHDGYVTLTPEHYVPHFKSKGVALVVRLNEPAYDASRFTRVGVQHVDLYYPDGANPPEYVLHQFLQICEQTQGAVAVHCKAGLGRTGTCIAAYMMKHDRFSAKEAIGWLRLCRPGSVIGPQQEYLESIQIQMWQQGDAMRAAAAAARQQRSSQSYKRVATGSAMSSQGCTPPPPPAAPLAPPKSPGRGRLLATRTISIFGGRKSVDLSASVGIGISSADLATLAAATDNTTRNKKSHGTQGDHLVLRKQQLHHQGYVR